MPRDWPLSLLMFTAYRAAEDEIFEAITRAGWADLTRAQARLLAGMDPDGTRVQTLAMRARISKQTAVSLLDRLEDAGYVERAVDPVDRRARIVRFTARSQGLIQVARQAEQKIADEWRAVLGAPAEQALRDGLEKLNDHLDPR